MASILLMPHLISISLATERLDGDLLARRSSTHSHAYMWTHTHIHSIPCDPSRQMEERGKSSGMVWFHHMAPVHCRELTNMYPCTQRQMYQDVLKAHITEMTSWLKNRTFLFDYWIIRMPKCHWLQLLIWICLLFFWSALILNWTPLAFGQFEYLFRKLR